MPEIDEAILRHKRRVNGEYQEYPHKLSKMFSKILLSIILVLSCTIYVKLDETNLAWFQEHIFTESFMFTKFNNWYRGLFGNILPTVTDTTTVSVSSTVSDNNREAYLDGYKITTSQNTAISTIASGLLVYLGEKENYGNVAIIQGVDGIDIWYGGITDLNYKLYDYVEAGTILGNTSANYYYLLFLSDNTYLTYEEYMA